MHSSCDNSQVIWVEVSSPFGQYQRTLFQLLSWIILDMNPICTRLSNWIKLNYSKIHPEFSRIFQVFFALFESKWFFLLFKRGMNCSSFLWQVNTKVLLDLSSLKISSLLMKSCCKKLGGPIGRRLHCTTPVEYDQKVAAPYFDPWGW